MPAHFELETQLWNQGKQFIVGIDEVGRGPWAGPVVAAAIIFPPFVELDILPNDSKQLSKKKRYVLKPLIEKNALAIGIGEIPAHVIDDIGIVQATQKAIESALGQISLTPDHYLVDAFALQHIPSHLQTAIIQGDATSATIAAASIIAKVYRDELMINLSQQIEYKNYGFEKHKGYGAKLHREIIEKHGLTDIHRKTFIHFE